MSRDDFGETIKDFLKLLGGQDGIQIGHRKFNREFNWSTLRAVHHRGRTVLADSRQHGRDEFQGTLGSRQTNTLWAGTARIRDQAL